MATVMSMHWPEVSMKQYDQTRRQVAWETDLPKGAKFHVAWFAKDGLHVLDIWESQADFERFAKLRLMPAVRRLGVQGQPKVQFELAHSIFAPDVASK
ncbi:MAG: hypothetical protein ABSA96_21325 [Candidatus Acidiferrales bacterium]|jgi:hypothetical protein